MSKETSLNVTQQAPDPELDLPLGSCSEFEHPKVLSFHSRPVQVQPSWPFLSQLCRVQ
jgi:hypothetical protein